ncbi:hypothetical protein SGRIM128S_01253 [Streptomyces griseomycini]
MSDPPSPDAASGSAPVPGSSRAPTSRRPGVGHHVPDAVSRTTAFCSGGRPSTRVPRVGHGAGVRPAGPAPSAVVPALGDRGALSSRSPSGRASWSRGGCRPAARAAGSASLRASLSSKVIRTGREPPRMSWPTCRSPLTSIRSSPASAPSGASCRPPRRRRAAATHPSTRPAAPGSAATPGPGVLAVPRAEPGRPDTRSDTVCPTGSGEVCRFPRSPGAGQGPGSGRAGARQCPGRPQPAHRAGPPSAHRPAHPFRRRADRSRGPSRPPARTRPSAVDGEQCGRDRVTSSITPSCLPGRGSGLRCARRTVRRRRSAEIRFVPGGTRPTVAR